jgi:hypothetical protein
VQRRGNAVLSGLKGLGGRLDYPLPSRHIREKFPNILTVNGFLQTKDAVPT